jgi:hypothetical protein
LQTTLSDDVGETPDPPHDHDAKDETP